MTFNLIYPILLQGLHSIAKTIDISKPKPNLNVNFTVFKNIIATNMAIPHNPCWYSSNNVILIMKSEESGLVFRVKEKKMCPLSSPAAVQKCKHL